MVDLSPLGDRDFLARFETEGDAQRWAASARAAGLPGVVEITVAYASAAVFADSDRCNLDALEASLRRVEPASVVSTSGRRVRVPVLYDGADLAEVAARTGLTPDEVVAVHAGRDYMIYAIGFQPGFPYAGYLDDRLAGLPRRADPRTRVPAGSVAIAGRQTGIYPRATPGGWLLLGRTPAQVVDVDEGWFPLRVGDRIRFEPIVADAFEARAGEALNADESEPSGRREGDGPTG